MPKGKKAGGRDWEPGQSGNPNGRPALPGDVREARKINAIEVTRRITKYLDSTKTDLETAALDPNTPALDLVIIKVIVEAGKTGDHTRLNFLMDRTIGKVTEKIDVKLPKPTIVKLLGEDAALVVGPSNTEEDEE